MSLFPAYQDQKKDDSPSECPSNDQSKDVNKNPEWLINSSYQKISECLHAAAKNDVWIDSSDEDDRADSDGDDDNNKADVDVSIVDDGSNNTKSKVNDASSKAAKVHTSRKQKSYSEKRSYAEDLCYEDKSRNKRLCSIETLERAVRPAYKLSKYKLNPKRYKRVKRGRFVRYYLINLDSSESSKKSDSATAAAASESDIDEDSETIERKKTPAEIKNLEAENKVKQMTQAFNKKLAQRPTDTDAWLEYISFQDQIAQLDPSSCRKRNFQLILNQKKLSIAEKGLQTNRDSIDLLKTKLQLMSELLPADQFAEQLETMIQKDAKNIILWQALIMVVQTSCALCKISKVLNLYAKCFPLLKQKTKTNPKLHEKQSLELLHQCLGFLRNAGLWEQMWEIIRSNLCLNLALEPDSLQNVRTIDEATLMSMEELILVSKLPLNQLWLRIESLRESCHWTSVNVNDNDVINLIGDEKRIVSSEDISDFIYPTISRESNFRLVVSFLHSLKVPLLPSRHCTLKDFNLEQHGWNIDSLEFVLPMIYSTIWTGEPEEELAAGGRSAITDLLDGKLTSGPQCIQYHPARDSFVDFVRAVFDAAAQKLPTHQRTSILIWWFKFERLLIFLAKHDSLQKEEKTAAANRNKKLKSVLKNFLKKPEHRNNLYFYRELALIEHEIGERDKSIQILNTAISSQTSNDDEETSRALFSLYRTILEILINPKFMNEDSSIETRREVAENLKRFVSRNYQIYDRDMPVEEMLYNETLKFLMNDSVTDQAEDEFLLPNVHSDALICYAYLFIGNNAKADDDATDVVDLFDRCLARCDKCPRLKERFYELKVTFLMFLRSHGIVKENTILQMTVPEALEEFPNNFYLLYKNAFIQNELPCWKVKSSVEGTVNVWSVFAKCLAGRARIAGLARIGLEDSANAMVNKMLSFHRTVLQMKKLQDCPLIWMLYMLLLREHNLCEKKGEEIYYEAVNQCPWARSVYLNAAEIAPQILSQIQDLMKEKEIRIHVTPEELDILREE